MLRRAPFLASLIVAGAPLGACMQTPAPPVEMEPHAVVLSLERAPTWAKAGAKVEVRDENASLLLQTDLVESPPVLVDLEVPQTVRRLIVAVQAEGHVAKGDALIEGGYASCNVR